MEELSNPRTVPILTTWLQRWNAGKHNYVWRKLERGAERMRLQANLLDWSVECEGRWLHAEVQCIMASWVNIVPICNQDPDRDYRVTMQQSLRDVDAFSAPRHSGQSMHMKSVLDDMKDMEENWEVVSQKLQVVAAAAVKRLNDLESKNRVLEAAHVKMSQELAEVKQELAMVKQAATADRLEFQIENAQIQVEAAQQAHICLNCFANQRDVVILPCSHGFYCSTCLQRHRKRKRTCPMCNAIITGSVMYRGS